MMLYMAHHNELHALVFNFESLMFPKINKIAISMSYDFMEHITDALSMHFFDIIN